MMCIPRRRVSFQDEAPLVVPEGASLRVECSGSELLLGSSLDKLQLGAGVTLEFSNCVLSSFATGAAPIAYRGVREGRGVGPR